MSLRQSLHKWIDLTGHQIGPKHNIPIFDDLIDENLSIRSDICNFIFDCEYYLPGFNYYSFRFCEVEIGGWGYLDNW